MELKSNPKIIRNVWLSRVTPNPCVEVLTASTTSECDLIYTGYTEVAKLNKDR